MPIYEYRCQNDHRFEVLQKFSDEALTECEVCGAPAQRVLHPVAIHFKGSGFYSTDYGRRKKSGVGPGFLGIRAMTHSWFTSDGFIHPVRSNCSRAPSLSSTGSRAGSTDAADMVPWGPPARA